jgi:hypothetical protein
LIVLNYSYSYRGSRSRQESEAARGSVIGTISTVKYLLYAWISDVRPHSHEVDRCGSVYGYVAYSYGRLSRIVSEATNSDDPTIVAKIAVCERTVICSLIESTVDLAAKVCQHRSR